MNRKSTHLKMVADRSAAGKACNSTDRSVNGARGFGTKEESGGMVLYRGCFTTCGRYCRR